MQVIFLSYPPWFVRSARVVPVVWPARDHCGQTQDGSTVWAQGCCSLSRWEGHSQASCFISDCHSPDSPLQQGWSQEDIFISQCMWHLQGRQLQEESSIPGSRCRLFQSPPSQHKLQFQGTLNYSGKMSWMHCNKSRPLEVFVIIYQLKLKLNSWFKHEQWRRLQGKPCLNTADVLC